MIKFKELPEYEKPRERLLKYGVNNLTNEELISIILKTGTKDYSVKEVSYNLLTKTNNISDLKNITFKNLISMKGIGLVKAIELISAIELGRRVYQDNYLDNMIDCTTVENIVNYFKYLFRYLKHEEFYVIYLDNKNKYIDKKLLFKGTLNFSSVHPREIFKEAYLLSASSIVCIHNHPSGDVTPSKNDNDITRKINEIALIHSIPLIDHIIIGKDKYYSYYKDNKLK